MTSANNFAGAPLAVNPDSHDGRKHKTVHIDIFDIPADEAEQFLKDRDFCIREATKVMEPYCEHVAVDCLDPDEGQAVVGYYHTGEVLMSVVLDPFEIPVMKVAYERGKLKEYILAANGLTEDMMVELSKKES
ncbi:hypothetical protein [Veillonella magna]|uniref:hypothetical protein n=1 Tax=Veillonella magna TaxID=464322 RepID=UPI0003F5A5A1|nr:hypothetical protein [Veillonella magna]